MKKILLFVTCIAAFSFNSCSSDEGGGGSAQRVKATIDGNEYTFTDIEVTEQVFEDYTDVMIIANHPDDPDSFLRIMVTEGVTGEEAIWEFVFYPPDNGDAYPMTDTFVTNVTENGDMIKGTFSGNIEHWDPEITDLMIVTDGEFTINR